MDKHRQIRKAQDFLALHHDPKLLVLPNIWDPLGARMLEGLGYPAVATASAAVAFSLGYDDGQKITFATMLDVIGRIASCVDVPVTADIEGGYAVQPEGLAANMRQVLQAGVVGINLEDSIVEGGALHPVNFQCDRIRAVRAMADREGIPLVINARTDPFLGGVHGTQDELFDEAVMRSRSYLDAGADCIYPIMVGDIPTLTRIREATGAPINVYASASTASMQELENAGISRLSLGPGMIRASLTTMRQIARELRDYGSYERFTDDAMPGDEIRQYVSQDRMPE